MRRAELFCLTLLVPALILGCRRKSGDESALRQAAAKDDVKTIRALIARNVDLNARGLTGQTALHGAREEAVKLLIAHGAEVNAQDRWGRTPLQNAPFSGKRKIAQLLINAGARVTIASQTGETPLHLAAWRGDLDMVKLLIIRGADINAQTRDGSTSLLMALSNHCVGVVEYHSTDGVHFNNQGKAAQVQQVAQSILQQLGRTARE